MQNQAALHRADQNQTFLVVKNRLRERDPAGLRHRIDEQTIRLIRSFVGREIIAALEIDRVDFLDRDELSHFDAAVRLGLERFQLSVFDAHVLAFGNLVPAHCFVALDHDFTGRTEELIAYPRAALMPWNHKHDCICGKTFWCRFDILPYQESRALCREWPDSICDQCLNGIYRAQDVEGAKSDCCDCRSERGMASKANSEMRKRARPISHSAAQGFTNGEQSISLALAEKNLWVEVLIKALADLGRDKHRVGAARWIKSNDQSIGAFCWVCHSLDLDCEAVRGSLVKKGVHWRKHDLNPCYR